MTEGQTDGGAGASGQGAQPAGTALAGLAAFVTGGATGIGLACARRLARDGATVTIAARTEERLRDAADELESVCAAAGAGGRALWVVCDVTDEESVTRAVDAASEPLGGLHLAVASAGTGWVAPILRTGLAEWNTVLETNLTGVFLVLRQAGEAIARSGGGSMVAVSSLAGITSHRFMSAYCASKAGVDMLVRVAADELGAVGVRVNSVQPSIVDTPLASVLTTTEEIAADYLSQMPVPKVGQPEDVAEAVRFLLGPESSWVTGEAIAVDGGHHLRRGPDYTALVTAMFGSDAATDPLAGS